MVIGIDGPAGSGKGTIAKLVAERLNLVKIDTGAMYRCLALATLRNNIDISDEESIIKLAKTIKITFGEDEKVFLNDEDVTQAIRSFEVSSIVSPISAIIEVREELVRQQRELAKGLNVIMEGRDITTVVFPEADYKFYLDASVEERARRRLLQNKENNIEASYEEIKNNILQRDFNDMNKKVGALRRTAEQIYIDSTDLTIEEVVNMIVMKVEGDKNEVYES